MMFSLLIIHENQQEQMISKPVVVIKSSGVLQARKQNKNQRDLRFHLDLDSI